MEALMNRFPTEIAHDRRLARRHNLRTPLRVRVRRADAPERRAESENLSQRGVFFATDLMFSKGAAVDRNRKFDVSALLAKFHVCGRVDLMLQTGEPLSPEAIHKRRENPERIAPRRPLLPAPILGRDAKSRLAIPLHRSS
jgi:hypothetical protein